MYVFRTLLEYRSDYGGEMRNRRISIPYRLQLLKMRLFRVRDGETHIRKSYRSVFNKELNTATPEKFSEKLHNRLLEINRRRHPIFTRLADKVLVRDYVSQKVGDKYLNGLIWSGLDPSQIPFDDLPSKCVIKTNHGSGGNIVWNDSRNKQEVIQKLKVWLTENYYWVSREYQYYEIPPRILIEKFLDDGCENGPLNYSFWCLNGQPEIVQIDNHLHDINPFYDIEWNKLPVYTRVGIKDCDIKKPDNFQEMLMVASVLSSEFDFVRVDLYNVNGEIFFGELTFTPGAGKFSFKPDAWDVLLGKKWKWSGLSNRKL